MTFKLIDRDKLIECLHETFHLYDRDEGISKGIDIAMGVVNEQSLVFARESEKDERIAELEKAFDKACECLEKMNYACDDCIFRNIDYKCTKGIQMNPDGSFDCDNAAWWKEQLLKEVSE